MLFVKIKYMPVFWLINTLLLVNREYLLLRERERETGRFNFIYNFSREIYIQKHKNPKYFFMFLYAAFIYGTCSTSFFQKNDKILFC